MYHKIIAGYDPHQDECGKEALELAAALAEPAAATVLIATVMDLRALRDGDATLVKEVEARVRSEVDEAMRGWPLDVKVSQRLIDGTSAAGSLHQLAVRRGADLIALGSTHRNRLGEIFIGTTGEHLLYGAPCGVAVAPHGYRRPATGVRTLGVAFDGSAESRVALNWAADAARALGATLHAIAVVAPLIPRVRPRFSLYWAVEDTSEEQEGRRQQMRRTAADALTRRASGIDCEVTVRTGDPAEELRDAARDGVDVLVTGSRGYGPLKSVLLGTVSGALARDCPVPVLVVPRAAEVGRVPAPIAAAMIRA